MASNLKLPDEIMIEILLKLPLKSILRCNSLSKHYYSLIHSQFFIRRHLALNRHNAKPNKDRSIVSPIQGSVRLFDRRGHFQVLENPPDIVRTTSEYKFECLICGPVNGLYCVIESKDECYMEDPLVDERVAIWNPSKRDVVNLPPAPKNFDPTDMASLTTLLMPPAIPYRHCANFGFGYDNTTDDYKVVLIYKFNTYISFGDGTTRPRRNKKVFYVYSVKTGEWRDTEGGFDGHPDFIKYVPRVFVSGACHWVYDSAPYDDDSVLSILAFDLSTELHRMIQFPTVGDEYEWPYYNPIVNFNGCLGAVSAQVRDNMNSSFDVWVMTAYGVAESWSILFRVSLAEGLGGRFLGIVRDRFFVAEGDGWLVSYDLYTKDKERYNKRVSESEVSSLLPYEESYVRIIKSEEMTQQSVSTGWKLLSYFLKLWTK